MIVILLNGYPQSGKDTFADIAMKTYGGHKHSTIDNCKEFAVNMGWDGVKDTKSRKMLSDLKKFYTEHFDGPIRDLTWEIQRQIEYDTKLFFTFSREGYEIKRIKEWCESKKIPFYYIFVIRKEGSVDYGNDSDNNICDGAPPADYICYNQWNTIEKYSEEVLTIIRELFVRHKYKY